MRVGINCLQVDPSFVGGVTSYTVGLLQGFAHVRNGCRFRVYVTAENQHLFETLRTHDHFGVVVTDGPGLSLKRTICRATSLLSSRSLYKLATDLAFKLPREMMDAECDLIYTPTATLQWFDSHKPTVLSMHDIQHVHYPEFFSWARRLSRRITYGLSAKYATYFQASSQFIKDDLLNQFREVTPEQIEVIPEGVAIEEFAGPRATETLAVRYSLPEQFLFYPAQFWPHKNHLTVLRALKHMETKDGLKIPLVLTGGKFSAAPKIFDFIADQSMDYVHYLGKVPFEDLVALYQKASFLITAALYEASSLPILEAAAAGTPIIASRTPPNQEASRVLQLNLFNPLDPEELARLILALWKDDKTASAQAAYNRQHITVYSWKNAARKYVHFFERIVGS